MAAENIDSLAQVRAAALSRAPISIGGRRTASPHEFYRYPARFSPALASSVIDAFTQPGDVVGDFFVGGGTTLVEARRAGRIGIGSDINALSVFVTSVKTRLYDHCKLRQVVEWSLLERSNGSLADLPADAAALTYFRNVTSEELVEQRRLLLEALGNISEIESANAQALARCVLLRTAQWGFDMRRDIPEAHEISTALGENAVTMVEAAMGSTREYRSADRRIQSSGLVRSLVLHQGLPGIADHPRIRRYPAPKLILTSPPYPGVYVNYHRWKVGGRRETALPYFLANCNDGNGLAHYTMSARSDPTQRKYFAKLAAAFRDIARVCDSDTHIVQVVGFNDVEDQLARYLLSMQRAGFSEIKFDALATASDGRLWRDVPGRRWWAHAGARASVAPHTAHEVVLVHRLAV